MLKKIPFTLSTLFLMACSSIYKNQNPLNSQFPQVKGQSLQKQSKTLPDVFKGKYTILLVGYKQNTQFDIDRWILGLTEKKVKARVVEVPTIPGLIPRMISNKIDDGMRSGIPGELWVDVVTLYGEDAKKVVQFTGNEKALNARVMLLDPEGKIKFFHDRGFSVAHLNQLLEEIPSHE